MTHYQDACGRGGGDAKIVVRSLLLAGFVRCALLVCGQPAAALRADEVDFDTDIRPILTDICAKCHGGVKKEAGFSVISRGLLLAPTEYFGEPVVVVGNAADSELIRRISAKDVDERMPPEGSPMTPGEIDKFRRWIDQGVTWPSHWSYAPVAHSDGIEGWATQRETHPVDRLVRRRLRERGIEPSPPAARHTIIRRLSLDLTGLLPQPRDVDAFERDRSPQAYRALVDRLLESPHFGERWARHWLDEARYADSEGYEKDTVKADAFRYRDWVIHAINDDMPFDRFTVKQIAGDLLADRTDNDLIATKFHLQTQFNLEGGVDAEEDRTKRAIDRVNTVGTVWLGTTIGCCQCHDHPYDPLRQRDFYAMYAFFNNLELGAEFLAEPPGDADKVRRQRAETWSELSDLLRRQSTNKNLSSRTQSGLTKLRQFDNAKRLTRYLYERTEDRRPTYVFQRGDFLRPLVGDGEVYPDSPGMLPPLAPRGDVPDRLDLANWLVDPTNTLTARVTVNKIWMHLFGRPLAAFPQDFGSRGAAPTNPQLLDYLADWFVHEGAWSRKRLIRLIVTSQTYRQSSAVRPDLAEIDPDNDLLARQNAFRVEAEIVRDIALEASGLLCRELGGPSVFPPLPEIVAQQTYAGNFKYRVSEGDDRYRRGLYTFFRRTAIDPNLSAFDCPDSSISTPRRDRSNNALQALATLQNEVFHEAAQAFARRLLSLRVDQDGQRLGQAFRIALSREPQADELPPLEELLAAAREYYQAHPEPARQLIGPHAAMDVPAAENAAWVATGRVILNLDEFLTRN